ncbi:MAG: AraC family transcriptional regulator ligand-binding domain-containing protein [Lysobacterales bacterium]
MIKIESEIQMELSLQLQPQLEILSREKEKSQIVIKWLSRVQECLAEKSPRMFEESLRRARVSRKQLATGEGLNHEHFDKVMDYLRRHNPDITLCFLSRVELLDLGMLGYAVISCPTVGKGQGLLARYQELTSDRFTEQHLNEGGKLTIRPMPTWRHLSEDVSIAEDCLGGNWRAINLMMGPDSDYSGASVHFAFDPPAHSAIYEKFFGPCAVHFNAGRTELVIPSAWLDRPVTTANTLMSDVAMAVCERLLGPGQNTRIDTVRAVRRRLLNRPGHHMLSLEEAADEMCMSTAQLRKRLYRAGTSYKSIVLEVRMVLALHYLQSTHLTVQEIAYLLDYSQPGPFSRAFKKYFGQAPITIRSQSQQVT